ncbi:MAG: DUF5924 family protein [Pseudomonadota bacterium]
MADAPRDADETPTIAPDEAFWRVRIRDLAGRLQRYKKLLPVLSFITGVVSALLMKRGFSRIPWLLGALFVTWIVVGLVHVLGGRLIQRESTWLARVHFGTIVLAQSASQEVLFFVLPFYFWSTTFFSPNMFFFNLLVLAILATLIDPVFERLAAWPPTTMLLLALSNFAALNFALPVVLGLRNNYSLHVSVALTVVLLVLFASYTRKLPPHQARTTAVDPDSDSDDAAAIPADSAERIAGNGAEPGLAGASAHRTWTLRQRLGLAAAVAIPLMIAIWLFDLQVAIPPAPLRIVDGTAATSVQDREALGRADRFVLGDGFPERVYCFTAIQAPRGLDEKILHVWKHDGQVVNTVELREISGGREQGYRTWSFKSRFPKDAAGDWTCEVRTGSGQIVGRVSFEVAAAGAG